MQTTYPADYVPPYPVEDLIQIDYWIEAAGNTLEAHVTVPALLPYLNPELLRARAWLRDVRKYLRDKDKTL